MFSSVSNKSIMLIKPSMIRALSAQAAPAAVSSSKKVRILCFGFSHNLLKFSLARETDTKMTRAEVSWLLQDSWQNSTPPIHHIFIKFFVPFGKEKGKNMARPGFELTINQSKTNAMALSIGPQSCSINNTKL